MSIKKTITVAPSSTPTNVTVAIADEDVVISTSGGTQPPANTAPVARAGNNQQHVLPSGQSTITTVLDGSASTDAQNNIKSYGWRRTFGPGNHWIKTPGNVTTEVVLPVGKHTFELRIADGGNPSLMDVDFIEITVLAGVQPPTNKFPEAKAGDDRTVKLPNNEVVLDGSLSVDPDGTIVSYKWVKEMGPACTLSDDTKALLEVKNMLEGIYRFRLNITDDRGASTGDEVIVTVEKGVIVEPPETKTYPLATVKNTAMRKRIVAGYEDWNGQNYAQFPWGGYSDKYFRFVPADIVKGANGTYDWTRFDNEFKKTANQRGGFSFGFMVVNDSDNFLAVETIDGARSRFCEKWLRDMQKESVKPFQRNGMWIPNWNSQVLDAEYREMCRRVYERLKTQTLNGIPWIEYINYIDIREYAMWGEWHNGGLYNNVSEYPSGTRANEQAYRNFIDVHCQEFPDIPLAVLFAAYDANWLPHTMTPPSITDYVLKARNNAGLIGWRRDQWGQTDNYISDYLQTNNRSFGSSGPFRNIIMERWKSAMVVGEPYGPGANLSDLKRQVEFYHACMIGNGNYNGNDANSRNQFIEAANAAGAKISLTAGELKVTKEFDFDITMNFDSWGVAPIYDKRLKLQYELIDSTGKVAWTNMSPFDMTLKMGVTPIVDHYKVIGVPKGTYSLRATIKNKVRALPLFNNGQTPEGYLLLHNAVEM